MSYYANGGGKLELMDGAKIPVEIMKELENSFTDVSEYHGFCLTHDSNYQEDKVAGALNKLAPYVKSGDVEFHGEDGNHWRFLFFNGTVQYQTGRIVYEPADLDEKHSERMELMGFLTDTIEDWLESKGLTADDIPSEDRENAIEQGEDPEGLALIYGEDYDELTGNMEEVLINYGLLEREN